MGQCRVEGTSNINKEHSENVLDLSRCESSLCHRFRMAPSVFLSEQKGNCPGSWYSVLSDFAYYGMLADRLVVFIGFPID